MPSGYRSNMVMHHHASNGHLSEYYDFFYQIIWCIRYITTHDKIKWKMNDETYFSYQNIISDVCHTTNKKIIFRLFQPRPQQDIT